MRRILLLGILCFLAVAATGCKKAQLRRQLKELMGTTIVLPEKITCVYNGEVYPMPDSLREKAKMIVYVDSTDCSKCRISRFVQYVDFFRLSDEVSFFVPILLLSVSSENRPDIQEHILDIALPFPVYIDDRNTFLTLNTSIPHDELFYSMLTGLNGEVLLVGDPSINESLKQLYFREILN